MRRLWSALPVSQPKIGVISMIIFAMPGQGTCGPVPLDFMCEKLPVFACHVAEAEEHFYDKKISVKKLLKKGKPENTKEEHISSFVFSVGLAKEFISRGFIPDCIVGHSLGEISALCTAEAINYTNALKFVYERASLMDNIEDSGAMAAVREDEERLREIIAPYSEHVSIAALNGPKTSVISGRTAEVRKVEKILDLSSIRHKRLKVPFAAHSPAADTILRFIENAAPDITGELAYKVFSTVTGSKLEASELQKAFWRRHCRGTVLFAEALASARSYFKCAEDDITAVEFGVHRVLASGGLALFPKSKWYGACTMPSWEDGRSQEYCFAKGIENTLSALKSHTSK